MVATSNLFGGKVHNSYSWRHQIFMSEWHSHVTRNGVSSNYPCCDISGKWSYWQMWFTIIWYYINHLYVSRNLEIHSILSGFCLTVCDITQRHVHCLIKRSLFSTHRWRKSPDRQTSWRSEIGRVLTSES